MANQAKQYECPEDCKFDQSCNRAHLMHHIRSGIPTKISHSQINLLPSRTDFLDPKLRAAFAAQVKGNKPILFMPNSVVEKPDWVNGIMKTRIYLFGALPCGSKTCVILEDIDINLEIMVPSGMLAKQFDDLLRTRLMDKNIAFTGVYDVRRFRLHGFQKVPRPYKQLTFNNLQDRKKCIEMVTAWNKELVASKQPKLETASDDTGSNNYYFPKVAREHRFATADWNRIERYNSVEPSDVTTNCAYVFRVSVGDFHKLTRAKRAEIMKSDGPMAKTIDRDPIMVGMWDIETYRSIQNGIVPTPADNDFTIFNMCSVYFQHHTDEPLLEVCVVDKACNARKDIKLVVECGTERNVLDAHMEAMGRMAPDITGAFNGGNFDWPLYREKLRREGMLVKLKSKFSSLKSAGANSRYADTEESVLKWSFRKEQIKIDAETSHPIDCVADFPGTIDTDVLPVFLKMYPRAEVRKAGSLNFFLAKNGLEAKEDMPYKRMFKIYERACKLANIKSCHCGEAQKHCACCKERVRELDCIPDPGSKNMEGVEYTDAPHVDLLDEHGHEKCCFCGKKPRSAADLSDVGYYCVIDCVRPQQLYVKRTIIPDKRELSTMSYVSLYDSFYRADGMKVCNVIGAYCHKRGIAFSNARNDKPDSEKDHYPGAHVVIPNRGLHSDKMRTNVSTGPKGTGAFVQLPKFMRERPITGLDFASLYPSLMMCYNISPDMIVYTREEADALAAEGYSIHHIKPFDYEKGAKKGAAINKHMSSEGWTVRHNGIFNPKTDTKTVKEYVKYERYDAFIGGKPEIVAKYPAADGPTAEQAAKLDALRSEGQKVIRKVIYEPIYGRDALPGERMGIFSFIVKKLFDKRVPIKAEFVRLSKIKEDMDKSNVRTMTVKNPDGSDRVIDYKKDVIFNINKVDAKQKALKVLANTFYGKSGDFRAPIYELLVAAGITCAGQENLKRVIAFTESKDFGTQYGDTDSAYLTCPDRLFTECDAEYISAMKSLTEEFAGVPNLPLPPADNEPACEYKRRRIALRVKWWQIQVEITMRTMGALKEEVSDFLLANTGTCFLNMAYEEVLFPTVLCGKKKYFGIPHIESINFWPKELFVKGIDIVKQGQARISKQLGEEFMFEATSPENELEMIEIADAKIRKFYRTRLDPTLFALNARYRPDKKNVSVQTCVKRMVEMQKMHAGNSNMAALYEPPEAGDKFEYIVVKKEQRYTLQGNKIDLKKGDKMELMRVYRASQDTPNPMEIDLNYYMKGMIIGIFARFIAYHPDFQPPAGQYDMSDKEQYKKMDQHCIGEATKYLEKLCDSITGFNAADITRRGRDYRAIYRNTNKRLIADATARYGGAGFIMHNINVHNESKEIGAQSTRIINQFKEISKEMSVENDIGQLYLDMTTARKGPNLFAMRRHYMGTQGTNITKIRLQLCEKKESLIVEQLYQIVPRAARIVYNHENNIIQLIEDMRKAKYDDTVDITDGELDAINGLSDEEQRTISEMHNLLVQLIAVYRIRSNTLSITKAIEIAKTKLINDAPIISSTAMRDAVIQDTARTPILASYQFQ